VALEDDPEDGRRAYLNRRERESLGSLRFSGRFGDMNESGLNEEEESLDDLAAAATSLMDDMLSDEDIADNETTRHLRALMEADDGLGGHQSGDLGMRQSLGTDGEQTFEFRIPDLSHGSPIHSEDNPREDTVYALEDLDIGGDVEQDDQYSEASEDNQFIDYQEAVEDAESLERSVHQTLRRTPLQSKTTNPTVRIPKTLHRSKLGNEYPSLPPAVIKKLASTYSRACGGNGRLNKDTVLALSQASDWFFEQISDDLATYSTHARRKTIEEADVVTLMKR
jgi:histone H3/H4